MTNELPQKWRESDEYQRMIDGLDEGLVSPNRGYFAGGQVSRSPHPVFGGDYYDAGDFRRQTERRPDLELELGDRALQYNILEYFAVGNRRCAMEIMARKDTAQIPSLQIVQDSGATT